MNKNNSYKDRKYDIRPYDSSWPAQFEQYASQIRNIFNNVRIEHIGSTSVPNMVGKPCIDILVIINDLQIVEDHIPEMEHAGFEYAGQFVMEGSRLFRVMKNNELLANIHFFLEGHPHNAEMILLRNYLRTHEKEVESYSHIKEELYTKYANDYASYRKFKDEYMNALKHRAQESTVVTC